MTHKEKDTMTEQILETLQTQGLEAIQPIFEKLLNEAMKIERENASWYERNDDRLSYSNGYKDKTIHTRMGPITVQIP